MPHAGLAPATVYEFRLKRRIHAWVLTAVLATAAPACWGAAEAISPEATPLPQPTPTPEQLRLLFLKMLIAPEPNPPQLCWTRLCVSTRG